MRLYARRVQLLRRDADKPIKNLSMFDDQGFNGGAIGFGPGAGISLSET